MKYLKLLRTKHYIKNLLIFIPLFFGGRFFLKGQLLPLALGFCAFSLTASSIYIVNDIIDIEYDRNHPVKKQRPLASGDIDIRIAVCIALFCLVSAGFISIIIGNANASYLLLLYFILNIIYSKWLKNQPILDVAILSSGFLIRVLYGGVLSKIEISKWLFLVIISGSFFMGLGKRRNELIDNNARAVLKKYNYPFLNSNMYVCMALTDVFYTLWAVEMENAMLVISAPLFVIALMRYSYDIENCSDGDPINLILGDAILIALVVIIILIITYTLYL